VSELLPRAVCRFSAEVFFADSPSVIHVGFCIAHSVMTSHILSADVYYLVSAMFLAVLLRVFAQCNVDTAHLQTDHGEFLYCSGQAEYCVFQFDVRCDKADSVRKLLLPRKNIKCYIF
jgi:hypothetical protein